MSDDIYYQLAKVLDTLPQGFPSTESGVEIKILKWIFEPEEAVIFCDLTLNFETTQQISERTGRPLEGLEEKLIRMGERGEILAVDMGGTHVFKMIPYAIGIYEFTGSRMDEELAKLNEEYLPVFLKGLMGNWPPLVKTIPIEEELPAGQEALPYQKISDLLDKYQSFRVNECHCRKEKALLGRTCDRPFEVCLGLAPIPNAFDNSPSGRVISREEAKSILSMAEEKGLVHVISNTQEGQFFICNCCSCCCGMIASVNELGISAWDVFNSEYYAVINKDLCSACGTCADERCQVDAIEEGEDAYEIIPKKCIGCGLCVTTCPERAISLAKKSDEDIVIPPADEVEWLKERGKFRGVDFSKYM